MEKELDWTFTFKMGLVGVGVFLLLGFALGTTWVLRWSEEADQAAESSRPKTNPYKPLRAQIMSFNTITLFFLLMSIAELRTDGFLSPRGVDPDQIPSRCKLQQQAYTSVALGCALLIVLYNYFVFTAKILAKPYAGNVRMERTKQRTVNDIVMCLKNVKSKNTAVVVEIYPYALEFFFFALAAVFAILMYFIFVLANYGVIKADLFGACV